jgi:uncharacterized OsmC-like protein
MTSAENLTADVEGDIAEKNGVLKVTHIRLKYHFKIPSGMREKAERAVAHYADLCPAYQTVKDCIQCTWTATIIET